jgi:hypothetical protein
MKTRIGAPRGRGEVHPAKGLFGFALMVLATLLAVATIFFAAEAGAQMITSGPLSGKIVVIDPGHGGSEELIRLQEEGQGHYTLALLYALIHHPSA